MQSPWIRAKLEQRGETSVSLSHGLPYLWCQRITGAFSDLPIGECGQPATSAPAEYPATQSTPRVTPARPWTTIIRDIHERVKSRMKLATDIDRLSSTKNAAAISQIGNWSVSGFAQFKRSNEADTFVSCELANEQCFYFAAVVRSSRYPDGGLNWTGC